ncbi:MAG: DUF2628 domain-containing protein [Acutalibacteraceae bacterium]|nr:DUF2628 domain-containing protein [Acutalibacteraceae bacterium]
MANARCKNCGEFIPEDERFCPDCGMPVGSESEKVFSEMSDAELHSYIGKNSSRYVDIFSKNRGKSFFVSFNWAAGLFGVAWLCYRKMYKYAVLFFALNILVSAVLSCGFALTYKEEIKACKRVTGDSVFSVISNLDMITTDDDGNLVVGDIPKEVTDLQKKAEDFDSKVSVVFLALNLALALFADCLYKRHIQKNPYSTGGVSVPGCIIGAVAEGAGESVAETVILIIISALIT